MIYNNHDIMLVHQNNQETYHKHKTSKNSMKKQTLSRGLNKDSKILSSVLEIGGFKDSDLNHNHGECESIHYKTSRLGRRRFAVRERLIFVSRRPEY